MACERKDEFSDEASISQPSHTDGGLSNEKAHASNPISSRDTVKSGDSVLTFCPAENAFYITTVQHLRRHGCELGNYNDSSGECLNLFGSLVTQSFLPQPRFSGIFKERGPILMMQSPVIWN